MVNVKEKITNILNETNTDSMQAFRDYSLAYTSVEHQGTKLLLNEIIMKISMVLRHSHNKAIVNKLKNILPEIQSLM